MKPLQVGLLDDNVIIRKMMTHLLSHAPDIQLAVAWESGEQTLAEFPNFNLDVMLIDLDLPGVSGEICLKALSAMQPDTALVVLTAHDDPRRVFNSLRAGANGYILKSASPGEILTAIKAASIGGTPLSPGVARLVIEAFREKPARKAPLPLPSLAPRERQILEQLAQGKVPKEVAVSLALSYATVRDYLKHIYKKLHVRSRTEAVLKYLEAGNDRP